MGDTFAGIPECRELGRLKADIAIIGIPHATPYRLGEASQSAGAPSAIRAAMRGYASELDHFDFDLGRPLLGSGNIAIVDCGDLDGDPNDPEGNCRRATEIAAAVIKTGAVPIVIGGDDSVPIPFLRAFEGGAPLTLIQIDAHIDWRNEVKGIKEGYSSTMRRASEMPWIERMIQVGMRGVGSARMEEVNAARAFGSHIVTANQVHEDGIEPVLDLVPEAAACVVTIDCDGLDPSIMPAVGAPAPGGLTYWQVINLLHGLSKKAEMIGFDLVEFVPEKDIQ